jgi:ubiquinone biosynthesis protein
VHAALKRPPERDPAVLLALLAEQRRTNRLLQALVWSALGFLVGMVAARVFLLG